MELWIFLLLLNAILYLVLFSRRTRRRGEPPMVKHKYPLIGGTFDFGKKPLQYLQKIREIYGEVCTVLLAGREVHFFTNPIDVKYLEKERNLKHDEVLYDFATRVVGSPHAIDVGGDNNPRGPEVMQTITKTMRGSTYLSRLTESCIATATYGFEQSLRHDPRFVNGEPMPLYELCGNIIYDITFNMFFGYRPSAGGRSAEKERLYEDFKTFFDNSALLVTQVPIAFLPKVKKARENLIKQMAEFETQNRIGVSDLIQSITKVDKDHVEQRARHLLIILWSAQANSRPALFWILLHLLQNPEVGDKILEEYEATLKDRKERMKDAEAEAASARNLRKDQPLLSDWLGMMEMAQIDRRDLDKMVILDACIKESLRLVGSSMAIRQATKDTSIRVASGRKYRLRKGDWTAVFSQVTDMDPIIHEQPEEYVYNRFLTRQDADETDERRDGMDVSSESELDHSDRVPGKSNSRPYWKVKTQFGVPGYKVSSSRALLTFGYGTNRCPGRHIALIEIKYCVLLFLRHFKASLNDPNQKTPLFNRKHLGFGVMPPMTDIDIRIAAKS